MSWLSNKIRSIVEIFISAGKKPVEDKLKAPDKSSKQATLRSRKVAANESNKSKSPSVDISGAATQFPSASLRSTVDIVIGLDFGTSSTKVVLRDPFGGRVYAIPFHVGGRSGDKSYLLPTLLSISPGGTIGLKGLESARSITNIKLQFIVNADEILWNDDTSGCQISAFAATASYLACVLQETRSWFFANCMSVYGSKTIRWYLNVGIPTVNFEEAELVERYRQCITTAWSLSVEKQPLTMKIADDVGSKKYVSPKDLDIHPDAIQVYPEVAAEVAGYARSNMREDGMHLLVDIGAGTLDVSTFNLVPNDNGDTYAFMQTDVRPYGAYANHRERLKIIDNLEKSQHENESWQAWKNSQLDATSPVPKTLGDYIRPFKAFAQRGKAVSETLKAFEPQLLEKNCRMVRFVVGNTKKKKDPRSQQWKEGLPVFICGGGSALHFYQDMIHSVAKDLKCMGVEKFIVKKLPKPDGLAAKGLSEDQFHRIYVAYGLSYPYDQIGRIIPSRDIEDDVRLEPHKAIAESPSKDQV